MKGNRVDKENGMPGRKRKEKLVLEQCGKRECRVGCTSGCARVMGGADMMSELDLLKDCAQEHGEPRVVLWCQVRGQYHLSAACLESSWGCFPMSKIELENALSKLDKMRLQKHKANEKVLSYQCT